MGSFVPLKKYLVHDLCLSDVVDLLMNSLL